MLDYFPINRVIPVNASNNNLVIGKFFREDFGNDGSMGASASDQIGNVFTSVPFTFNPTVNLNFVFGQPVKVIASLHIILGMSD